MALIVCKKCERIFSSESLNCPYCGTVAAAQGSVKEKNGDVTSIAVGLVVLVLLVFMLVILNTDKEKPSVVLLHSCQISACPAGTKGVTSSSQQEPYYTCKSGELSDYANYVLGVMVAQINFAGVSPKITSKTGEPDVPVDQQPILDGYRKRAGVSSFEEALSKCYRGRGGKNVTVLDDPKQGNSIYVQAEDNRSDQFWLPKAKLDKRP
jgi:hypothetical protein